MAESVFNTTFAATAIPALSSVFGGESVKIGAKTISAVAWKRGVEQENFDAAAHMVVASASLVLDPAVLATNSITIDTNTSFEIDGETWRVAEIVERKPTVSLRLESETVQQFGGDDRRAHR